MTQGKYISEDTQELLIRAGQILGETPVLNLTNWQMPISMDGPNVPSGSCSRITLKNTIAVTDTSILICTGTATTTCAAEGSCPTGGIVSPTKYVNMIATVNLVGVAQTGVVIQFNYLINEIPITDPSITQVTVNLNPGNNTVYLFPTNRTYSPSTTITLYGATIVSQ
jgi:hypothetical protein